MMMNRAVIPEWRDRAGTVYTPVRRNADGSVDYRLAGAHQQSRSTAPNLGSLAQAARTLGIVKTAPATASPAEAPTLSGERYAPSDDQLKRFQAALAASK